MASVKRYGFLTAWAVIVCLLLQTAARADGLAVSARAAILIDGETGRVLYELNADTRLPMASTTKIMTALLAIERCPMDDAVTASENASGVTGTSIYLGAGETLTMREMLLGLMLRSGNDAAVAIAEHVAGSTENFAAMMNARAASLGADACFVTPNGLDASGHGATARAMALIACEAMKNETFREIVATQRAVIPWKNNEYSRVLNNKNRLLTGYDGATGIKTGFTGSAGRCLVFSAEREGFELIGVVLNCADWFGEAEKMLDWGFDNFSRARVAAAGDVIGRVRVARGFSGEVSAVAARDLAAPVCESDVWSVRTVLADSVEAPVKKGAALGWMALIVNGEETARIELEADSDVERTTFFAAFVKVLSDWPAGALL